MSEPSSLKVSVTAEGADGRRSNVQRLVTADRVIDWIKKHEGLDDYTKNGLIELVKRYPTAALPFFRRNFNQMIQRVRAKRKKERNGEVYEQDEEVIKQPVASLSLDEALGNAFKPEVKEQGPELQVSRRPLFDEPEVNAEELFEEAGFEPVQFEGFDPGEDEEGPVVPDGPPYDDPDSSSE